MSVSTSTTAFAVLFCNGQVATIVGTNGPDLIIGTPGRDVIVGLGGNDDIRSGGGNDVVCAGNGNDVVRLGNGADRGFGGPGNDTILGQAGNDLLVGNTGNDTLRGNNGADTANGGPGTDDCDGGPGLNKVNNCENGSAVCQSLPLTSNFSNLGVFFVDPVHSVLVALTSDGLNVVMLLTSIPFNGTLIGAFGFPTSSTHCIVDFGVVDLDEDGDLLDELLLDASGTCDLLSNRTVFSLNNFSILDVPLGVNIVGQCSEIVVLNTASLNGENPTTEDMTAALLEGSSVISDELTEDLRNEGEDAGEDGGLLRDFQLDLEDQGVTE
ncbi:MAG TPA: calcium-binding protein [Thermodesulfobacteriota bacterium]|nr:calcium-binding protein [Thermodesulfobacteriota bacterium]